MYKIIFRPFWSYDVEKTEKWLSEMSEKGLHVVEVKRKRRLFIFNQGSIKKVTYRIGYDKAHGDNLPGALIQEGWNKILRSKYWYIVANENPPVKIKATIIRDGVLTHNRKIFYVHSGILLLLVMTALNFLINYSLFYNLPQPVQEHIRNTDGSPASSYGFVTYSGVALGIGLAIISIYSMNKIIKTNKSLNGGNDTWNDTEDSAVEGEEQLSVEEETELKRQKKLIVKRKFGWRFGPDQLEKWLEEMEAKGYNLYRISWTGIGFYFFVGSPRWISYCAEYQSLAKDEFKQLHKEMGWKRAFSTSSYLQKWTIWFQEYKNREEKPTIFSDKTMQRNQAKKIALTYTGTFAPVVLLNLYLIWSYGINVLSNDNITIHWSLIIMFSIGIGILGISFIKSWLFYFRVKNSN